MQVGASALTAAAGRQHLRMQAATLDTGRLGGMRALEAYERRGFLEWSSNRSAACDRLVASYSKSLIADGPTARRMVFVPDRKTANHLNERLRQLHREAGTVSAPEITLSTPHRSDPGSVKQITLAVGDRVCVWPKAGTLSRSVAGSFGVIAGIPVDDGSASVEVRLDNGKHMRVRNSWRIDYAYAVPWTAPQARRGWCDQAWVIVANSLGPGEAAVALTRHWISLHVLVDVESLVGPAQRTAQNAPTTPEPTPSIIALAREKLADAVSDAARIGQLCPVQAPGEPVRPPDLGTALKTRIQARLGGVHYPCPRVDADFLERWGARFSVVFGTVLGRFAAWRKLRERIDEREPITPPSASALLPERPLPEAAAPVADSTILDFGL